MKNIVIIGLVLWGLSSCQSSTKKAGQKEHFPSIEQRVTNLSDEINNKLDETFVVNLDHHKMAKEEGVYTPPSIATIFSDPLVNTPLIKENPLIGIDLPFKILCFSEADTTNVSMAFTSADFISKRHGIELSMLESFDKKLSNIVSSIDASLISKTNTDSISLGYGIIKIQSDYDFNNTIENLKTIVNAQNDTRWFGEIDFQKDASALNQEVNLSTLLLFGGPAPGGKAMMTTPKIGLDAFCQKLLVYENDEGEIWVAFNDIVAFSELYYNKSTKPQNLINQRLTKTFTTAVKKEN